ncbi:MAG: alpha/beta hydrolase family protein [Gammaproteobacteria bacterium]
MKAIARVLLLVAVLGWLPALAATPLQEESIRQVYVPSYDGVFVAAALRKPAGDGPFPAILYIHGGVGGSGLKAMERMLSGRVPEHFHRLGYVGFAADYRRYHFGEDEIQDMMAAYRLLASFPFVDKTRIAVIGGSHGGYLAQMLATRVSPAATVSFAGLTDIESMFHEVGLEMRKSFGSWPDWMQELLTHGKKPAANAEAAVKRVPGGNAPLRPGSAGYEVALELGWRYGERREIYRTISPKENADKVNGPVLYLVGGRDPLRVAGAQWIEALKKRGVVAEYSEHADMPHGFYWGQGENPPQQFHDALKVTSDFIERHVKKR